jgi:hypothetical protein
LAAQEKEVVFNVLKCSCDQVPDVVGGRSVTFGEPSKKAPARCDPDRRIDDRVGRKSMNCTVPDTEDIAWQMKRADLPPTVAKALVRPNCALPYLVDVIRRFCFSKNLRTFAIFNLAPKRTLAS